MKDIQQRPFGATGLEVSALGFGGGHVGDPTMDERAVDRLLNGAIDLGITLVDTARSYGLSEERVGRHLAHRRDEIVLSTKVGYGVEGVADWTGPCVTAGVDAALVRLRTDVIDVVHLHSCPLETLRQGDVVDALVRAVEAGKARVAAYSGDNAPVEWAVESGRFGSIQTSVNAFDQHAIDRAVADARTAGLGVIAKRPLANAPWRFAERPVGDYAEDYWLRMREMGVDTGDLEWPEVALRFTAYLPGVATSIVGTRSLEHLRRDVEIVERGPLPAETERALREAFVRASDGWTGLT
jgi:aryl-alcohol dehydrogenase-like predicted oxidoreductase